MTEAEHEEFKKMCRNEAENEMLNEWKNEGKNQWFLTISRNGIKQEGVYTNFFEAVLYFFLNEKTGAECELKRFK